MKQNVFLGLGSNLNDRLEYLKTATSVIGGCSSIKIVNSSFIYETEPWGIRKQNSFLNQVIEIETSFSPSELLTFIKESEVKSGRIEREKWHEREIDIDILFYDDVVLNTDNFSVPHKEVHNRKFVLVPMCELNESFVHPVFNKTMSELLADTKDISEVKIFNNKI